MEKNILGRRIASAKVLGQEHVRRVSAMARGPVWLEHTEQVWEIFREKRREVIVNSCRT